jgi:hypothetical protein
MAKAAAMDEQVDVMVGDWMSELNMPTRAHSVAKGLGIGYEPTFQKLLNPLWRTSQERDQDNCECRMGCDERVV